MNIVCISKPQSTYLKHELTFGKIYSGTRIDSISHPSNWRIIKSIGEEYEDMKYYWRVEENDRGFIEYYDSSFFITLEEWREMKIIELLGS